MVEETVAGWNWARTHQFQAVRFGQPTSVDQLHAVVGEAASADQSVRCVGSRHSFTGIADANVVIDLSTMPEQFDIAPDRQSVTVSSAMTYARMAELLAPHGLAVANTASLPHISIAGAVSTATHGSGVNNGNLATAVRSLEIATSDGHVRTTTSGDPDFPLAPIALGAQGAIVAVELDLEPTFDIEQLVHDNVSWSSLTSSFDEIAASAYSVSIFTDWQDHLQVWTKRRVDQPAIDHSALHDGSLADSARHPIPGVDAQACTAQGPSGLWSDRLPHFRAGATPSVGAEVQSEFFVDYTFATEAIDRLRSIGSQLAESMMVSEIRTVRRDDLWLSPQYERDCVAFHFTWHHDLAAAHRAAQLVAHSLAPLRPLPHWGKVFDPTQFDFAELYPRLPDALQALAEWDPTGVFRTGWIRETTQKQT